MKRKNILYARAVYPTPYFRKVKTLSLRACLHEGGGPQVGEVTCGGLPHLTCKRDHCMDRRVTSPTWGLPPPCKQALRYLLITGVVTNINY